MLGLYIDLLTVYLWMLIINYPKVILSVILYVFTML